MADVGSAILGGTNQVGFFGGGQFQSDPNAYKLGGLDQMTAQQQTGVQQAQAASDPNAQNQFRDQQQSLASSLMGTIGNVNAPSVAQQQLQQSTQNNIANAYAMASSGHPNAGSARMAANNAAAANQAAAGQGAMARAQEVQNAQGQLGSVLGNARTQDQSQFTGTNQVAQGYLAGQSQNEQAQMQANEAQQSLNYQGFAGAQSNALGGKLLSAAAGVGAAMMAHGGMVPGMAHGGDNLKNDTVPTMLSPGEVVLPRSVVQTDDAPEKAKAFVEAIRKKHAIRHAAKKAA